MAQDKKSVLVVGGPASGKTIYGAQLLGRLQEDSSVQTHSSAENLIPFEEALNSLWQGRLASHTSADVYHEIVLPVRWTGGVEADLVWPDYGGEQVRQMVEQRQFSEQWRTRVQTSQGWMLFLRLSQSRTYEDLLSRPLHELTTAPSSELEIIEPKWSDQALYVELLQLLLYAKSVGNLLQVTDPKLVVLLSCWDELTDATNMTPEEVLRKYMPMLADYINATWLPGKASILGLSSLGKSLSHDSSDDAYICSGPQSFGYIVLPDGAHNQDLTFPLSKLLK